MGVRRPYNFVHLTDRGGRRPGPKTGDQQDDPRIFGERTLRQAAALKRTLTQTLFGDPPPGYSALNARKNHHDA